MITQKEEQCIFSTCWLVFLTPAHTVFVLMHLPGWICPRPDEYFPPADWTVCGGAPSSHLQSYSSAAHIVWEPREDDKAHIYWDCSCEYIHLPHLKTLQSFARWLFFLPWVTFGLL